MTKAFDLSDVADLEHDSGGEWDAIELTRELIFSGYRASLLDAVSQCRAIGGSWLIAG